MATTAALNHSLTPVSFVVGAGSGPVTFNGFVGGAKPGAPAVIVIQEWWGVTDTIKAHASKIGDQGFRVLVPDIYKGKMGVDKEEAHHLMSNLDFPAAVQEISAAAAHLKQEGAPAVGITGFCMGGALTMGALAASPDLTCGAPFYGVNFGLFEASQLASKPVQGHFGAEDTMAGFADPETGKKLEAELKAAGGSAEVFIYPGVGHAFMNESPAPYESFEKRKEAMGFPAYDAAQAELAWGRLFGFLEAHLKGKKDEL
jgi:carboxymethylenebutenolidase|eukprot:Transcript_18790.p2 GENE.Transcript_18790~~Transcript_18790.p2  ORF type:complete len:258 (-),score=107.16 Transcript_18790:113-886(-)